MPANLIGLVHCLRVSHYMLFCYGIPLIFFHTCTHLTRAIVWLQNKRDVALERSRPPSHRREEQHEFRVGRLKHERVKVPRGDEVNIALKNTYPSK